MIDTEPRHANSRTGKRSTEGSKQTGAVARTRNLAGEKRRGRPPGAKNKPKSLMPVELAEQMLLTFEGVVPPEHFEYLKKVVKGGESVSTERELDILILLLGRNLHPALVQEMQGENELEFDEDGTVLGSKKKVVFRRDVTERLKVLNSLIGLKHQVEKSKADEKDGEQPLLKIVADRDLLAGGRLGILVGGVSGSMVGDADDAGRSAIPARTVSN